MIATQLADRLISKHLTHGTGGVVVSVRRAIEEAVRLAREDQRKICAQAVYATRSFATKLEIYESVIGAGDELLTKEIEQ